MFLKSYRTRKIVSKVFIYILIGVGAIVMVLPFAWMVSTSLVEKAYYFEYPPELIPENPTFNNYIKAWTTGKFQLFFLNSLIVTVVSVIFVILFSAMMAYAFARLEFPGKEWVFYTIIFVLMVPNMVGIIPQFLLAKTLNLRNSLWGLILFYVSGSIPFNAFLLRGFFETLPHELEDAILIDGGNYLTIFLRMIIPLSTPALATVSIFSFLGYWDEYILALTLIDDVGKRTLPVAIATYHGQHGTDWGLVFAASIIAIAPIITMFVLLQRYFVGGLTQGAFKG